MTPPSRPMPPPPAIGSARSSPGTPENASGAHGSPGNGASAVGGAEQRGGPASEGSAAAPGGELPSAKHEAPSEDAGSRSLPIAAERLRVPTPAPLGSTVPRVPAIDSETSATLRVPSVGAAGDSAGSWPRTDGWDLDDEGDATGSGNGSASVPSVPKPAAASVPSIPKPGSIPSIPKPAATKDVGTAATIPKLGTAKELGTAPSAAKAGPAKEVGSVPSVPKLGSVPKVGPLPKPGARPTPAPRRAAAEDADARPLFGSALAADGSLLSGSAPGSASSASGEPALDVLASFDVPPIDASAIDASAPPSSASPLDALPSFDAAPSEPGAPQDGFPSMDSSALLGVALEPVVPYDPGPRLPVPGMLRDGAALSAADFRGPARTPRSQPAAAMPPPRGMVPPKPRDEEEPPRLRPGDTQSFVAQVAEELMEDVDRQRAEKAAAAALAAEALVEPEPVAARPAVAVVAPPSSARVAMPSLFPVEPSPLPREAEPKRRGMIVGLGVIGLAAAIGLFVWLSGDDEPPTQTAAVTSPPAPDANEPKTPVADEKAESPALPPPSQAEEAPEPAADGDAVAAEGDAADGAGEPAEPVPTEAEPEADPDAAADAEAEPVDDGSAQADSAPRKSSSRGSRSSGKSSGGSSDAAKEAPAPAPKTDDAPSAAKLLKQARSAYNAGKGSTAYSLASKSNRMEPSGEAAEVMALAACQMGSADKAKAALRTVPLFSRGSVRSTCKTKHGVKLGL